MIMQSNKLLLILLGVGTYLLTTGLSYVFFSKTVTKDATPVPLPSLTAQGGMKFDDKLPKTEPCPLNGAMYSKQQRAWWEKHRPLGVMIENHQESRPQSGLSNADVIYEAVAEGGITRFLAIFHCQDAETLGPVRSARTYFLDFISEYGSSPLYVHVGGANRDGLADALSQIEEYGWSAYNDLNQFSIGFPVFWRDYDRLGRSVATEHTMYSTTGKLWDYAAKKRKLTNVDEEGASWKEEFTPYQFKEDVSASQRAAKQTISFDFWDNHKQYVVEWVYDKASNAYKRINGGQPHEDKNNNNQLRAKNIVILFMQETHLNDAEAHVLYKTKGNGKAIAFIDGKEVQANWRKPNREARTVITDQSGNQIKFNKGLIWFEILPTGKPVSVK